MARQGTETTQNANPTPPTIVGIGASAGGVQALRTLFGALPEQVGAAFVVVMHLDPDFPSELSSVLGARSRMPVHQVDDGEPVVADHVYVIPPDRQLAIADGEISARPFDEPRGRRAPIDHFFRSLSERHGDGIAVILTGAGADGTLGVKAMKEGGGIVLVQDPEEATHPSMPRSAIAAGVADFVLPVQKLAEQLVELVRAKAQLVHEPPTDDEDELVRRILAQVRVRTGHDFSRYKRAAVLRRIARRVQVTTSCDMADYSRRLRDDSTEVENLFGDLLISVTTFFRDPHVFDVLARSVVPRLFDDHAAGGAIRVWIPGCATGEEAYSLAMLFFEEAARRDQRARLQVFSSDLDGHALAFAREGRYPETIAADVSEERLGRFFEREGAFYRARRELRDAVLFTNHSVLLDPPFSRMDLVSCRNLLIYFDRDLQKQVLETLQYALNPGGYLLLGTSESADFAANLFRPVDGDAHIYRSTAEVDQKRLVPPVMLRQQRATDHAPAHAREPRTATSTDVPVHLRALEQFGPPSAIVDEAFRVLHLSESAGRFLQQSGGRLTSDLVDAVRHELRFDLRLALRRAFERGEPSLSPVLPVRFNGSPHRVLFQVRPLPAGDDGARRVLVLFLEGEAIEASPATEPGTDEDRHAQHTIRRLQEELQATENRLRALREESESANEELRATNEKLQLINEEYRSTAEEFETSKEELQSTNEELQTVNAELRDRFEEVTRAHNDMQNLLATAIFGTLFLDADLRISRFTPRLTELFNITAADEGRPITDFTHQLESKDLAADAELVLAQTRPSEREVRSRDGRWFLVRLGPYRTLDRRIEGVVASFVDISDRKRAEQALQVSEERLGREIRLVELSRSPTFVWDFDGGIVNWNRGGEELYGYSKQEAVGQRKNVLLGTTVPGGSFDEIRRILLERGTWSGELRQRTKDGRELWVETRIELFPMGDRRLVLESTRDITERKEFERRQELLLAELTHRVKNTLAVVQSIARMTLRSSRSSEDFVASLEGRLAALAESHRLLVESNWRGAELGELARGQLGAYAAGVADRLRMEGEPVMLPPRLATPFGLVFHELATNAAKHGALADPGGRIELSWTLEPTDSGRRLTVRWCERGGPSVRPPEGPGSGTQLIQRGVPGATVRCEFPPEGAEITLELEMEDEDDDAATS